ncbi:MAG: Bug family tripartite tricarboxylate transporter substrate binding protein [Burkholderiales bacterium]
MKSRAIWMSMVGVIFLGTLANLALAQDYPRKPVRMIVPFPPGGPVDILARALGEGFREQTGQGFVLDHKPGANTVIAATACKGGDREGYTLCLLNSASVSLNQFLYNKLSYDPEKDFEPVTNAVYAQGVLIMNRNVPANSFKELVEYSKQNPAKLNYASLGIGGDSHLLLEWIKDKTGASMTHIPFAGSAPAMLAFERGDVHLTYLVAAPDIIERIKTGQAKAILIPGSSRNPNLPDTPNFDDVGLPKFDTKLFYGVFAPAGTPRALVQRINAELARVIHSPGFHERFLKRGGFEPIGNSIEDFKVFLAQDRVRGQELVVKSGVKIDQ